MFEYESHCLPKSMQKIKQQQNASTYELWAPSRWLLRAQTEATQPRQPSCCLWCKAKYLALEQAYIKLQNRQLGEIWSPWNLNKLKNVSCNKNSKMTVELPIPLVVSFTKKIGIVLQTFKKLRLSVHSPPYGSQ